MVGTEVDSELSRLTSRTAMPASVGFVCKERTASVAAADGMVAVTAILPAENVTVASATAMPALSQSSNVICSLPESARASMLPERRMAIVDNDPGWLSGARVGELDGALEGEPVGAFDGDADGELDGAELGELDGLEDGAELGAGLGADEHSVKKHDFFSTASGHSAPPSVANCITKRSRISTPLPHSAEHDPHTFQAVRRQSVGHNASAGKVEEHGIVSLRRLALQAAPLPTLGTVTALPRADVAADGAQVPMHGAHEPHSLYSQSTGQGVVIVKLQSSDSAVMFGQVTPPLPLGVMTLLTRLRVREAVDSSLQVLSQVDQATHSPITQSTGQFIAPQIVSSMVALQAAPEPTTGDAIVRERVLDEDPHVTGQLSHTAHKAITQSWSVGQTIPVLMEPTSAVLGHEPSPLNATARDRVLVAVPHVALADQLPHASTRHAPLLQYGFGSYR